MTKGTSSFGKRHNKTHTACRRCGKSSYHIQKSRCSSCVSLNQDEEIQLVREGKEEENSRNWQRKKFQEDHEETKGWLQGEEPRTQPTEGSRQEGGSQSCCYRCCSCCQNCQARKEINSNVKKKK